MGQVKVDKVWATVIPASNGRWSVTFLVTYENAGSSPVYEMVGTAGTLHTSISGNSTVIVAVPSALSCYGTVYATTLNQGQNLTIGFPDTCDAFWYQLVHPGSVAMVLTFSWSTNPPSEPPYYNSTTIKADFVFG